MVVKCVKILPGEKPVVCEIDNALRSLQNAVGGNIEFFPTEKHNLDLMLDEEGKIDGAEFNRRDYGELFFGPLYVVGINKDGDIVSLTDHEVAWAIDRFSSCPGDKPTQQELDESMKVRFY